MGRLNTNKEKLFGLYMTIYGGEFSSNISDMGKVFNRRCFSVTKYYVENRDERLILSEKDKEYLEYIIRYLGEVKYFDKKSITNRYLCLPAFYFMSLGSLLLVLSDISVVGKVFTGIVLALSLGVSVTETIRLFKYKRTYKERTRYLQIC